MWMTTLALWQTVTIRWNGFISYALALGLQWDWWSCENFCSCSFYLCAKCNHLFTNYTHHFKSPDLCGYCKSIARSVCLLCYNQLESLELHMCSWQRFPHWKVAIQWLQVLFSLVQISSRNPSYPSIQVLWWAPVLTSTQRKLHPHLGACFWLVVAVAMGDTQSGCHNTSPGIALPTPSHYVNPLCTSSAFLCIDTSEICVYLLNPHLEP